MTKPGWIVVRLLSFTSLFWIGWSLAIGVFRCRCTAHVPFGDIAATRVLRLVSGVGAFVFGACTFATSISGHAPESRILTNLHVLQAVQGATLIGSLLTSTAALAMFPPISLKRSLTQSLDTQDLPNTYQRPPDAPAPSPTQATTIRRAGNPLGYYPTYPGEQPEEQPDVPEEEKYNPKETADQTGREQSETESFLDSL
jgi:hypothetical protein